MVKQILTEITAASLLKKDGADGFGDDPVIVMLEAISENGSINQAAKAVGMSYKAVWGKTGCLEQPFCRTFG